MALLPREQMPVENTWKLEDMIESEQVFEQQFMQAKKEIAQFAQKFQGKIGIDIHYFKEVMDAQSKISLLVERTVVYALMRRDQDNANALYQGMADRASSLAVDWESASSFILPEMMKIEPETFEKWRKDKLLSLYAQDLDEIARLRAHTLSQEEEKILAMTGEVCSAPQTVYKMLDYADMRFPAVQNENETIELSHGSFIHLMENEDRGLREKAFTNFYQTYDAFQNTYAATLSASVKNDVLQAKVRSFPSAREAALYSDAVPVSVYDNLVKAIRQKLPTMHRYMRLRKKALKIDELHMYDIYAPLNEASYDVEYPQAQEMIIQALSPMGNDYINVLQQAFSQRWIDVFENIGKSSGAYSWGCYGTHPYVLMNYRPNIDSVFTLAHEMGHAMHSFLSDTHLPYEQAHYKILVAEVASTVNESMLMEHLLQNETDVQKRMRLLNYYAEQFRTTVFRQVMFAEFETMIHEASEKGEPLTAQALKEMYLQLNRDYYGEDMISDELIGMEWARISHFYNAFYVYKYATGFSAAVALSRTILQGEDGALSRYMQFLQSGGSDYPLELLSRAGVDLRQEKPVLNALAVFEQTLDRLEALI